jgi:hypothetical protein
VTEMNEARKRNEQQTTLERPVNACMLTQTAAH